MEKLPLITSVFMNVTDACNMACRYCFVKQRPRSIELKTAKAAVDFLVGNAKEQGDVPAINFFGGEPTLCWDGVIAPLTAYIREELGVPFQLSMTSNGILLDDEKIAFMKKQQIGLLLSMDGDRATQEYNRPIRKGKSSFDALVETIPKLVEAFPELTFRSTVIPHTCANLFSDISFAAGAGFSSYFVMPNVFERWDTESRRILTREMRKFSDYYIHCFRTNKKPIYFSTFEKCFSQIRWVNYAVEHRQRRVNLSCQACGKCGLGATKSAAVDTRGNLYACQELSSHAQKQSPFYIGDIHSGADEERRRELSGRYRPDAVHGSDCAGCKLDSICDGGCAANNFLASGDLNTVPDIYCFWCQLLLEEAIRTARILGEEQCEGFRQHWEEAGCEKI